MSESNSPTSEGFVQKPIVALGVIAGTALLMLAAFLFAAGTFSPNRLSPQHFIDALEARDGVHEGFRRAHAKGICAIGHFKSTGNGVQISSASLFRPNTNVPVVARFSTGGGMPFAPDGRNAFRSMALKFDLDGGEEFRMAMNHVPLFIVSNPASFPKLHRAHAPNPATGKSDPEKVSQFFATHPETAPFREWMRTKPLPSSFANSTYFSANTFKFTTRERGGQFVRWRFTPAAAESFLDKSALANLPQNFLFEDLTRRLKNGPVQWTMIASLAEPDDAIDNPTIVWKGRHREVVLGDLIISKLVSEEEGECRNINFDPLILPRGVEPSNDPILFARSAAYSASLTRRLGEDSRPVAFTSKKGK